MRVGPNWQTYTVKEFKVQFNKCAHKMTHALELDMDLMQKIVSVTKTDKSTSFGMLAKFLRDGDGEAILALAALYCESVFRPSAKARANKERSLEELDKDAKKKIKGR